MPWPGHLEVNYEDRTADMRLMGLGWSMEKGRQGTNKLGAQGLRDWMVP